MGALEDKNSVFITVERFADCVRRFDACPAIRESPEFRDAHGFLWADEDDSGTRSTWDDEDRFDNGYRICRVKAVSAGDRAIGVKVMPQGAIQRFKEMMEKTSKVAQEWARQNIRPGTSS